MGRERPGKRSGTTGLLRTVMGGGVSSLDARLGLAMDGFGLINLDEFDRLPDRKMVLLKNWMQMAGMNVRKAHAKHFHPLPRLASFIGTTNQKNLLSDPTGSRRFLCVEVQSKINCEGIEHDQIYAQLKDELQKESAIGSPPERRRRSCDRMRLSINVRSRKMCSTPASGPHVRET